MQYCLTIGSAKVEHKLTHNAHREFNIRTGKRKIIQLSHQSFVSIWIIKHHIFFRCKLHSKKYRSVTELCTYHTDISKQIKRMLVLRKKHLTLAINYLNF
ncbi:hypothetical protein Dimus_038826 [Dionaea muscipula]